MRWWPGEVVWPCCIPTHKTRASHLPGSPWWKIALTALENSLKTRSGRVGYPKTTPLKRTRKRPAVSACQSYLSNSLLLRGRNTRTSSCSAPDGAARRRIRGTRVHGVQTRGTCRLANRTTCIPKNVCSREDSLRSLDYDVPGNLRDKLAELTLDLRRSFGLRVSTGTTDTVHRVKADGENLRPGPHNATTPVEQ